MCIEKCIAEHEIWNKQTLDFSFEMRDDGCMKSQVFLHFPVGFRCGEGGIGSVTFRDFLLFGCGRTCWQGCFVLETTEITRRNSQLFKTPKISEKY